MNRRNFIISSLAAVGLCLIPKKLKADKQYLKDATITVIEINGELFTLAKMNEEFCRIAKHYKITEKDGPITIFLGHKEYDYLYNCRMKPEIESFYFINHNNLIKGNLIGVFREKNCAYYIGDDVCRIKHYNAPSCFALMLPIKL